MTANWKTMSGLQISPFGSHYCAQTLNFSYGPIDWAWRLSPISPFVEPCAIPLAQYYAYNAVNASTISPLQSQQKKKEKKREKGRKKRYSSNLASFICLTRAPSGRKWANFCGHEGHRGGKSRRQRHRLICCWPRKRLKIGIRLLGLRAASAKSQ